MGIEPKNDRGKRRFLEATFVGLAPKQTTATTSKVVMLDDLVDLERGVVIGIHPWMNLTPSFKRLNVEPGARIRFNGYIWLWFEQEPEGGLMPHSKIAYPTNLKVAAPDPDVYRGRAVHVPVVEI